ncbi:hypothetical protein G6F22_016329 [Rhizopus arrhizus]|nr:hypothetical protein G6F22_016329 [Rhizopus arrhizus]KAG0949749.1 hypothetical protein G6F31_013886 [Rhizopus arrhizus]
MAKVNEGDPATCDCLVRTTRHSTVEGRGQQLPSNSQIGGAPMGRLSEPITHEVTLNEQELKVLQGTVQLGWQGSPAEVLHHCGEEVGRVCSDADARPQARWWRQEEVVATPLVDAPQVRGASTTPGLARIASGASALALSRSDPTEPPGYPGCHPRLVRGQVEPARLGAARHARARDRPRPDQGRRR